MIMPVLEYMEVEVRRVGNIHKGFVAEEAIGSDRPVGFGIGEMGNE